MKTATAGTGLGRERPRDQSLSSLMVAAMSGSTPTSPGVVDGLADLSASAAHTNSVLAEKCR
jgi:hypothetical protein